MVIAAGVRGRNTWTGEYVELTGRVVVLAAGTIESPRLWLNSELPDDPWVGKGLTTHFFDCVAGIFDEKVLLKTIGSSVINPFAGQNSAARFDYPGLGALQQLGVSPGIMSTLLYSLSEHGYDIFNQKEPSAPWDIHGRVVGAQLKELMQAYVRTLSILIFTDDEANDNNTIKLDRYIRDEHGPVPVIRYTPSKNDHYKRNKLAVIAADILKKAGAKTIIRADCSSSLLAHIHSTMRIGYVTDTNCEARRVNRLFIADNSVLFNSVGGTNPTLTTQALATRPAEKILQKYFN